MPLPCSFREPFFLWRLHRIRKVYETQLKRNANMTLFRRKDRFVSTLVTLAHERSAFLSTFEPSACGQRHQDKRASAEQLTQFKQKQ